MNRKGLKLQLALAIESVLGFNHALTIPNAQRYINQEMRRRFRIRDSTVIELEDWILALQVVRVDRVGHFARVSSDDKTPAEERFINIIDSLQIVRSNLDKSSVQRTTSLYV